MRLIWNGIVRNESKIIDRLITSLLPHVDGAVVVDTGSTDDTMAKITQAFKSVNKPVHVDFTPFKDFAQARNAGLEAARHSDINWDFALLADADMELCVDDPAWKQQLNGGLSYDMLQTGGAVSYANRRIVNRHASGVYRGVTHEYLDIGSAGLVTGARFIDYADGANRPEKYDRDIALLTNALATETDPGLIQRYHFYLGQSYFDKKDFATASKHYSMRVELGGFPEECWFAQYQLGLCYEQIGLIRDFVFTMLRAYEMRPHRVEPLLALARWFRASGQNLTSLLFSVPAMEIPPPSGELLFVNDWAHRYGAREEFGIAAYYDRRQRDRGAKVVNQLVLEGSSQARANSFWYLDKLSKFVPSFDAVKIPFSPDPGWVALNPSAIVDETGELTFLVRTVNYHIDGLGRYLIGETNADISAANPIRTRNFIGGLRAGFREIAEPTNLGREYDQVLGLEDSRLFRHAGALYTLSTVRQLNREGWCEQVLAKVFLADQGWTYGSDWRVLRPKDRYHEKNWMPWADYKAAYPHELDGLRFVYRLGTLVDSQGRELVRHDTKIDVSHLSGSSQVVRVGPDMYLCVVHEAGQIPGRSTRYYQHRFVLLDAVGKIWSISPPFCFHDKQIEFCAGLAYVRDGKSLVLSYGVRDCEAWYATMRLDEVILFLGEGKRT